MARTRHLANVYGGGRGSGGRGEPDFLDDEVFTEYDAMERAYEARLAEERRKSPEQRLQERIALLDIEIAEQVAKIASAPDMDRRAFHSSLASMLREQKRQLLLQSAGNHA
jgi:hypothetical protein